MDKIRKIVLLFLLLVTEGGMVSLHAAKSVRVFGYVVDSDNRGVELANVYVEENTTIGTTTNQNGYYELFVELPDTVTLVYSMIG